MLGRNIIVIGGSAGSISVLSRILRGLPADLGAAVFIVVHFGATTRTQLPGVLSAGSSLPVSFARDRDRIELGRVYVAPLAAAREDAVWAAVARLTEEAELIKQHADRWRRGPETEQLLAQADRLAQQARRLRAFVSVPAENGFPQ